MKRQRLVSVAGVVAGAGLTLLAAGRPWVTQQVSGVPGVVSLSATGGQAAPAVSALAVVAGAGAVVLLIAGSLVARLAGVVVVLAGAGVVASVVSVLNDPRSAAAPAVPAATGRTGPLGDPAVTSPWVWPALLGGLLIIVFGALAAVRAAAWSVPGRRFETPAAVSAAAATTSGASRHGEDPIAAWDALSRGEDPTS